MAKITYMCPYCFEKQKITDVEFRCTNNRISSSGDRVCPPKDDEMFTKFYGYPMIQKKSNYFKAEKKKINVKMPKVAECPECNEKSDVRICPKCHSRLPNDIDSSDDMVFAIIGAKETGKSHYIAVLIDVIAKKISASFDCSLEAGTDETIKRYKEDFWKKINDKKETIEATRAAMVNQSVREPLIYLLKFSGGGLFSKKIVKTVTLVFFDTAGEDLNDQDTMSSVNKYIYNSSGIIFLLDPLQLKTVRESLPAETPLPEVNTEIESIITRTTKMIKKAKNIGLKDKIEIPLAVVFTKIDALEPMLEPSSYLNSTAKHMETGFFDKIDCDNINMEIDAMLRNWDGHDFAQQVSTNYTDFSFFGVSALGCNPHATRRIDKIIPHRVEDPFLWLLWKKGMIKKGK